MLSAHENINSSLASSAIGDKTSCVAAIFVLSKRRGETFKGKLEGDKIARNFAWEIKSGSAKHELQWKAYSLIFNVNGKL